MYSENVDIITEGTWGIGRAYDCRTITLKAALSLASTLILNIRKGRWRIGRAPVTPVPATNPLILLGSVDMFKEMLLYLPSI